MAAKLTMENRLDSDLLEGDHYTLGYVEGREVMKAIAETMKIQLETNGAAAILRAAGRDVDAIVRDLASNVVQTLL